jgi:hypothetical protein
LIADDLRMASGLSDDDFPSVHAELKRVCKEKSDT